MSNSANPAHHSGYPSYACIPILRLPTAHATVTAVAASPRESVRRRRKRPAGEVRTGF